MAKVGEPKMPRSLATLGLGHQSIFGVGRVRQCKHRFRLLANITQAFGYIGLAARFLPQLKPATIRGANKIGPPALAHPYGRNEVRYNGMLRGYGAGSAAGMPYIAARRSISRHIYAAFAGLSAKGRASFPEG